MLCKKVWRSRCNSSASPHRLNLCKVTFRSVREKKNKKHKTKPLCVTSVCEESKHRCYEWPEEEEEGCDVRKNTKQRRVGDKEGNQSQSITCCRTAGAERKNCRMDDRSTSDSFPCFDESQVDLISQTANRIPDRCELFPVLEIRANSCIFQQLP